MTGRLGELFTEINPPTEIFYIPHTSYSAYPKGTEYGFRPVILDTSRQSSYRSNEKESRPKTKFFSLLIYAGYPIQ